MMQSSSSSSHAVQPKQRLPKGATWQREGKAPPHPKSVTWLCDGMDRPKTFSMSLINGLQLQPLSSQVSPDGRGMLPCSSHQLPKPKAEAKALAAAVGIGEAEAKAQAAGQQSEEKAEATVTAQDGESENVFDDSDHPWNWDDLERERLHMERQRVPSCPNQHSSRSSIDNDALQNGVFDTAGFTIEDILSCMAWIDMLSGNWFRCLHNTDTCSVYFDNALLVLLNPRNTCCMPDNMLFFTHCVLIHENLH